MARPRHHKRGPGRRVSLAAVVLAALVASCGGGNGSAEPAPETATRAGGSVSTSPQQATDSSTSSTATSSPSSPPPQSSPPEDAPTAAEQEVIERYRGYWAARFSANSGVPNPDHPDLAEFATGPQLEAVRVETRGNLERGLAYRQREDPAGVQRVQVLSIGGNVAVVQECFVDDGLVVRQGNGEVIDDDVSTHNVRGELVREDGGPWRVSEVRAIQVWEGVAGCALLS